MTNYKRDFFKEAHEILNRTGFENYTRSLLPNGKLQGKEYIVRNPTRSDSKIGSFSINIITGKWADFAKDGKGNDLISLTAYVKGITPTEACHYIGVPRLDQNSSKTIKKGFFKTNNSKKVNNPTKEETSTTDTDILEEEQFAIQRESINHQEVNNCYSVNNQPPEKEPPRITESDTKYFNSNQKYGCKPSAFYPYKNHLGITVLNIVRWDYVKNEKKTKAFGSYIYRDNQWKTGSPNLRPIYNLPEVLTRQKDTVLVVEGEKTAEAAKQLFPEYVVTTSSFGAQAADKTDWSNLKDRDVIISPDVGNAGETYAKDVTRILSKLGVYSVSLLNIEKLSKFIIKDKKPSERRNEVPKGYDLANSLDDGWTIHLIKKHKNSEALSPFLKKIKKSKESEEKKEKEEVEETYNFGCKTFKLTQDGLYLHTDKERVLLCGYLKPVYEVQDKNNSWGMLVSFKNKYKKEKELFLKRTDLTEEKGAINILQDAGLLIESLDRTSYSSINAYLNKFDPEKRAIGVDMTGWQDTNKAYMLPFVDEPRNCYSTGGETEYILQQKSVTSRVLQKKGSLDEWKRTVCEVCRGNHLHTFAILASLAAPLLKLLNEDGNFFHYTGSTSIGKSTILHIAKSVWGLQKVDSFRSTDNSLESVCKNSNDGSLFLDEIGEADADSLFKMVYMIANGITKGRANRNGDAKPQVHFTVLAQTTGEVGLESKLAEKKIRVKGGQLVRMIELDADRAKGLGTFDKLTVNPDTEEQFEDGKAQAEYLKEHANANCGVVIDEFMKGLFSDLEAYVRGIKAERESWINRLKAKKGEPEIDRVINRFSIVYAAGITARDMRIVSHTEEEIRDCVNAMFNNWLTRRGGDTPYELKNIISNLYKICIENGDVRLKDAKSENNFTSVRDLAGYKDRDKDEFWILPRVFERDVLEGRDKRVFLSLLVGEGVLVRGKDGKNTWKKYPFNEKSQRFYVISRKGFLKTMGEVSDEENRLCPFDCVNSDKL